MNEKISMYELLGLIEKRKQPYKIKFCGNIYVWEDGWYMTYEKNYRVCLGGKKEDINAIYNAFNKNVEILSEDKKIKKLGEKYTTFSGGHREFKKLDEYGGKILANKIDEIIDAVNKLEKEGK